MPADRILSGNPAADIQEQSGLLDGPTVGAAQGAFAPDMQDVVDELRTLNADFGIRPYRVFLVHEEWTGDRRGTGQLVEIARREILPVPLVRDMSSTTEVLRAVGLTEEGGLVVSEVSARYTEDDLMGRTPDLANPVLPKTGAPRGEFSWEVIENRASAPEPARRRYHPSAAPSLSRDGFQWRVTLTTTQMAKGPGAPPRLR